MTTTPKPIILGIHEDRDAQVRIATAFNDANVFYRFVTDRKKLSNGLRQMSPDILVVFGELASDFVIQVLDGMAADVNYSNLPVIIVASDVSDAPFTAGLRTGVVAMLQQPFEAQHVAVVKGIWDDLTTRRGTSSGTADTKTLQKLVDHLRRTRRSGQLTLNPRTPNEAKATFLRGKVQRATFLGAKGEDAVKVMVAQPKASWTFAEVAGQAGEGRGVVIEFGEEAAEEKTIEMQTISPPATAAEDEPLAFEVAQAKKTESAVQPINAPPSGYAPAGMNRILLVDDDDSLLRMFSTLFTKNGFVVTTASDGAQGAQLALQREFDLALCDLNMPHLDGWGMLRIIRDDFRTRELPIAFISAHDDYRESLKALDAGAQAYFSKGTRLDTIVGQAKKLLEPRLNALSQLNIGQGFSINLAAVGPQWFLRQLALRYASGRLEVKDGWATYELTFNAGACQLAQAIAGKYSASGERAFNAFIASRSPEGTWMPGAQQVATPNLFLSTDVLVERACSVLNENERRIRENLLISATQIEVNEELYAVYRQVGPKAFLDAARLICEEKLVPREVIGRLDMSPVDIEETLKDLMRRGVLSLKSAPAPA